MIFNTTHTNKEYTAYVNKTLSKPFSLLQRIKKNGIGSSRLIINRFSKQFKFNKASSSDINYANIEMRPKGIIVHLINGQERFAWIIPFFKLHIYNTDCYSIHADGCFIQFKKDKNYAANKSFFNKVTNEKINYLQLDYYDG